MKKLAFIAVVLMSALAASCNSGVKVDAPAPSNGQIDSVSYLIGVNFGSFIKGNNFAENLSELNMAQIKKGMVDFMKAEGTPYDPTFGEQFDIDLNAMNEAFNNYLQTRSAYKAAVNEAEGLAFLSKMENKAGVTKTESGLLVKVLEEGAETKVGEKDTVIVNYKGTLVDGTQFDANDSTKFVANQVIKGWTEGLSFLGEGGKAELYIPYELGYGERGTRGIAPKSTLVFEVEVLEIKPFVEPAVEE
ncbi:MAG: FKBP-type peptidyl-prolyl cis-trans isomerase [Candidatus Cryptobacteroides sp.]